MPSFSPIHSVLIVGGTHGNELSGVQAVKHWQSNRSNSFAHIQSSINIGFHNANKAAIEKRVRYVDEDLNRQFSMDKLQEKERGNDRNIETDIAAEFNEKFGPKQAPVTDFIIDIHNTTSAMGPTLIILVNDEFHHQLARFVKQEMPESVILVEDYQDYQQFAYLCTVAKRGVMVEVGPQAHSTLKADVFVQTTKLTETIVQFIDLYNQQQLTTLPPVDAFRLVDEIPYPTSQCPHTGKEIKSAMIHPNLQGQDFNILRKGQACFVDFQGNEIPWNNSDTYPHFIGEAAYDHLNLAFARAEKCQF